MSKHKDHADDPKASAHEPADGGATPIKGTPLTGTLPGAEKQPSRAMFRVLKSITGGHEPGELKSHAELVGPDPARPLADIDWLVKTKGIEPVDHVHSADVSRPDLEDEIERLTHENAALKENLAAVSAERDGFRAQLVGGGKPGEPSAGTPPPQPAGEGRHDGPKKK